MERKAIYVTQQGARAHRSDGLFAVSVDRAVVDRWPAEEVERVLVFGNAQITTQALSLLFRHGVHVSFFSPSGRYRGQALSPESGSVFLRLAQHGRFTDASFRLSFARALIVEKIAAGRALLRRFARNHAPEAEAMEVGASRLDFALERLPKADDLEGIRGIEGSAAADYFVAFDRMVRPPFRFERRSKHPARNAVNALLNLGYTLLADEIASRLEAAGFDPRIGYYHGVRYGRSSLALDLIEAHRVDAIDRLTLSILNRRMFTPEDFEDKGGSLGVRLSAKALRRYIGLYEAAMGEIAAAGGCPRARIRAQVSSLRAAVMGGAGASSAAAKKDGVGGEHPDGGAAGSADLLEVAGGAGVVPA